VWYVKSLQPQLESLLRRDRRAIVETFGDFVRDFFKPKEGLKDANTRPYDPSEAVR
jgi:hypothetical protein